MRRYMPNGVVSMGSLVKVTKLYNYPKHGVRVCEETISSYIENGYNLVSIEKDYILGCGITFRFFFIREPTNKTYKVITKMGALLEPDNSLFNGFKIKNILSMKFLWFSLGNFYILESN
jgi:hypothetical protein